MLWLRADPEAVRELRLRWALLRPQGFTFISSLASKWDVVVAPLQGTPEEAYYRGILHSVDPGRLISDRDPLVAISKAITYPRPRFSRLTLAVDSGVSVCGLAALADGTVLEATSLTCSEVGPRAAELSARVPHERLSVVVGDGAGFVQVTDSLLAYGLTVSFIDERGSTSNRVPLPIVLRDGNARAAVALALRASVNH